MRLRSSALAGLVSLSGVAGVLALVPAAAWAEECPNAAFRTGPSTHLPDCRAYELVSPPFEDAGIPELQAFSPDGSSASMAIGGVLADAESFTGTIDFHPQDVYSVQRTDSGWEAAPDVLPASEYEPAIESALASDYEGQSLDGLTTIWAARQSSQPQNSDSLFLRLPDHSIADVGPFTPPATPPGTPMQVAQGAKVSVVGESADLSHIVFTLGGDLWPGSTDSTLYEYVGTGNTTPMLVGVNNSGEQIGQCGESMGAGERRSTHDAVSSDGTTVFFTVSARYEGCPNAPPVQEVYARIDNGLPDAHTVDISEPSKEDCAACDIEPGVLANAEFVGASEDGSKVFFETAQPLIGKDTSTNLFEYDFDGPAGERVVRVSSGDLTVSEPAAGVFGEPVVSQDGSHVYFYATGVLTKTPSEYGESAEAGASNVYMYERDASSPSGHIAFVSRKIGLGETSVTPNGQFLAFTSGADLTPGDTSTATQVFEYDAQTGGIVRVSIGQNGFNDNGNVAAKYNLYGEEINNASIASPTSPSDYYSYRSEPSSYWTHLSVSADGAYVFFESSVGLTPQALNERVVGYTNELGYTHQQHVELLASNVYEYHDGRVSLISDGQDISHDKNVEHGSEVELLTTDESGDDVLFTSVDRLVGQAFGLNVDIYDARIDGGFPAPAQTPSCSEDTCQGQLAGVPTLLSPGSEFQAGGNPPIVEATAKAKAKKKAKRKAKKRPKKVAKRRGKKATKAAARGREDRKAGRS